MSEGKMTDRVQEALQAAGVDDTIEVAGMFYPRGHTGSMFAGGLIGGDIGESFGSLGDAVGTVGGAIAGAHVHDAGTGLPDQMIVGVSPKTVYGVADEHRGASPIVFQVERAGLEVKVHQRANVRVLELIHGDSGSAIELEGNRIPTTHSHDVIEALEH